MKILIAFIKKLKNNYFYNKNQNKNPIFDNIIFIKIFKRKIFLIELLNF